MHSFLLSHRDELIARCHAKVVKRPHRAATPQQLANGIPLFLEQLIRTLQAEDHGDDAAAKRISGPAGGDAFALSPIGVGARAHGSELLKLGYTVDQVVHDYGDLCQAITDLAVEREASFSIGQFRTLNRCLDNAIADAVTEFSAQREAGFASRHAADENERLGILVHELRNLLQIATMAYAAVQSERVPIGGSTGALVRRSLASLSALLERSLDEVRAKSAVSTAAQVYSLAALITEARHMMSVTAAARNCAFDVPEVDPELRISGDRDQLLGALVNLLQNAFKFTQPHTAVTLHAFGERDRVAIEVRDHCGGLPAGFAERMFAPFIQGNGDKSGLGLGLAISRRSIEAAHGSLTVHDHPGNGCVFRIELPRHSSA